MCHSDSEVRWYCVWVLLWFFRCWCRTMRGASPALWETMVLWNWRDNIWFPVKKTYHILSTSPQSSKYNNADIWYIDFWNWYIIINSGNSVLNNCSSFSKTVSGPHSIKGVFCFSCDHICWSFSLCVNTMLFVVIFASKICTGWGYIWSSLSSYHNG